MFGMMPFFLCSGCGDLEPEMQDTGSVVLKMNFNQRSSSRSSQVSQAEVSSHKTHLILALPSWENLSSNYRNYYSSFAQELMNPSDNKVSLEIPLNTQMRIFAFLFRDEFTMPQLLSGIREVAYYGESQPFSIGTNTNNLSLSITLIQVPGTGTDTGGGTDTLLDTTAPTASVTTATITTSGSAVVQSTETGTAYLVNTTVNVSNLASITVAADNKWNSVAISSAATNTYLTATGLVDGTYKVYAVDASGNLSSASINSVTVVTAATSATLATPYWQLIARQVDNDHFTDGSDELFSSNNVKNTFLENEDDNNSSTFMSIGNLNKSYYADNGTYKFKLVWGGQTLDSSGMSKEVTWTQTSWLTESTITNFTEIGTSGYVTGNYGQGFFGLAKSNRNECVLDGDGSSHNYWWNCAGAINKHNGGIPGPLGKIASSMHLYIWALNDGSQLGGSIQGSALSLTTKVTSLAGSGTSGSSDGTGTSASFNEPYAITTDSKNLYVADYGSHTIRKIVISTGAVTTLAGTVGTSGTTDGTGTSASFYSPIGITTDGNNLYVADFSNHTIRKIVISTGAVTTLAGTAGTSGTTDGTGTSASLNKPYDITTDGTNLYVADYLNHTIRKIVISTGAVTTLAGTAGISGTTNGTGTSARFKTPLGITTDGTNLYVVEYNSNLVRKIVISTAVVTTIADIGTSSASYNVPLGITTDGTNLYVAQMGSHKIHKIVISTGVVTTIAGSGLNGSTDGTGTSASFFRPTGITTDGISLYVADKDNHKIRKIE